VNFPSITDSRGNKSQTLFWVAMAEIILIGRFFIGVFTDMGQIDATSFAMAFSTILAPWVAREGIEKLKSNPSDISLPPGA
jgi:hypothetical protein